MDNLPDPQSDVEGRFRKQDWPYYWITRTSARYFLTMEKRLKPVGLDVPRWRVLMSLYEDEYLSVSEISDLCIIKLNTATKIIQRMMADGLVTTRSRPSDARVTEVTLTALGDARRKEARAIADEVFAASFGDFTTDEREVLNSLLQRVFTRLGELQGRGEP
ncbi:MarR family winged helix-turn-helix transcriptional regulator [Pseudooceanicola sp. HF7]|uniref:MarR family winged helix-turn-helix transcriptional regulator n=1 Tax=Pseudooceanicola sp. HF7 TaxID=2721560 RepID=UPI001431B298|nr:MarR family winged helix-turn-helix transcriptional regulator [Pseudooceanicola sp. HF7]NIZ07909.1 winged helix-turn-helix transcriptional regulator [Pseudooceanicola sp. HF7]